jgi:hypothetical protein
MSTVECVAGDKRGTYTGYTNRKCRCDECRCAKNEYKRQYREANREAVLEQQRQWREANRETVRERNRRWYEANREEEQKRSRRRYEANREAARERNRRWREANREVKRERDRRWNEANPDKRRAHKHTRRARKRDAFVEVVVPREVYERDNWTCHICDLRINKATSNVWPRPTSPTIDHVIPLAKGGEHSYANCKAAHLRCNTRKGTR